ncbi:hypothetical protein B0H19DRAFT_1232534 [Mycena capillaripes]|nr:hypothetical protein B0H19DRAFT_1232534 [Mycena capillaripes]
MIPIRRHPPTDNFLMGALNAVPITRIIKTAYSCEPLSSPPRMRFILGLATLSLGAVTLGQQISIETPAGVVQCGRVMLIWAGGDPPYHVVALSQTQIHLINIVKVMNWTWPQVTSAAGTSLSFRVEDASLDLADSNPVVVGPSCTLFIMLVLTTPAHKLRCAYLVRLVYSGHQLPSQFLGPEEEKIKRQRHLRGRHRRPGYRRGACNCCVVSSISEDGGTFTNAPRSALPRDTTESRPWEAQPDRTTTLETVAYTTDSENRVVLRQDPHQFPSGGGDQTASSSRDQNLENRVWNWRAQAHFNSPTTTVLSSEGPSYEPAGGPASE